MTTVPLTPVEILWVIMCTSSFPAMGLGAEKADPDVVRRMLELCFPEYEN